MLNMVKHDLLNFFRQAQICEQCLQNFFNINKAWVNNSQAIRYYEGGCRNFVIEIRALKIKNRGWQFSLENKQLQALAEENLYYSVK